jgi:hypothetical protein
MNMQQRTLSDLERRIGRFRTLSKEKQEGKRKIMKRRTRSKTAQEDGKTE